MTQWVNRTLEERRLLNPAFCAHLLWRAARGHSSADDQPLSLEECFLVLAFVLPSHIREALPRDTRTSLPIWLENEPLARAQIVTRARALVPFTREALMFAGTRGVLAVRAAQVHADVVLRFRREAGERGRDRVRAADAHAGHDEASVGLRHRLVGAA